jgi:hypothetical protein
MPSIYNVNEKLHKIRVKLYKNQLHSGPGGDYIARCANEASVNVQDICASMKNRASFPGSYEDSVNTVHAFFLEMMYQIADGFSVNLGFGAFHPNIGGTFASDEEPFDPEKHPISVRFQTGKTLRALYNDIGVICEGYADTSGHISTYVDEEADVPNTMFVPGNQFMITGEKIRIAGEDPACGLYMVPVDDPSKELKLTRIMENTVGKIIGVMHKSTGFTRNRVEIRTQFTGSANKFLKDVRIITSNFVLEEI